MRSFSAANSLLLLAAVVVVGCEREVVVVEVPRPTPVAEPVAQTQTLETERLRSAVSAFEQAPTAENQAKVKKALAELDGEIAELEEHVAKRSGGEYEEAAIKLRNLQQYRVAEVARFTTAQASAPVHIPTSDDVTVPPRDAVEDAARRAGNKVEDVVRKAGDALKD